MLYSGLYFGWYSLASLLLRTLMSYNCYLEAKTSLLHHTGTPFKCDFSIRSLCDRQCRKSSNRSLRERGRNVRLRHQKNGIALAEASSDQRVYFCSPCITSYGKVNPRKSSRAQPIPQSLRSRTLNVSPSLSLRRNPLGSRKLFLYPQPPASRYFATTPSDEGRVFAISLSHSLGGISRHAPFPPPIAFPR